MRKPENSGHFAGARLGLMGWILISVFLTMALAQKPVPPALQLQAQFLEKEELPEDFGFPLLELDYVVVHVEIENLGAEPQDIPADNFKLFTSRGKSLSRARPHEITPRIMNSKEFRRRGRRIHGSPGRSNLPPGVIYGPGAHPLPGSTIPTGEGRTLSANTATIIRETLEGYELGTHVLNIQEKTGALLYFKSKDEASKLNGSLLRFMGFEIPVQ